MSGRLSLAFGAGRRLAVAAATAGALCAGVAGLAIANREALMRWWAPDSRPELRELVAANPARRFAGRVTGGFAWSALAAAPRSSTVAATGAVSPDVQLAVARLEQRATRDRTAANLAAAGVARLISGNPAAAIDALEEVVALDPGHAFALNDLAVAYLARAETPGAEADVPRGFETSERTLALRPQLREAVFNHALAMERLGLPQRAVDLWRRYLEADAASPWAAEARSRLTAIETRLRSESSAEDLQTLRENLFDDVLPQWAAAHADAAEAADGRSAGAGAEALERSRVIVARLARGSSDPFASAVVDRIVRDGPRRDALLRGHLAYGRARTHYKRDRMDDAAREFEDAARLLTHAGSPLAIAAHLHRGIITYRQGDGAGAARQLEAILPSATRDAFWSVAGRITWTLGVLATQRGAYVEAGALYRDALAAFERAAEPANGAFIHMLLADNYERRGEADQAWGDRLQALARSRREGVLLQSAQSSLRAAWPHVAATLQSEAVEIARRAGRLTNVVDALRLKALTSASLGRTAIASESLAEARKVIGQQQDRTWDRLRAEVDLVEARLADRPGAARGIDAATRAYDYFSRARSLIRLPDALLSRARLRRLRGELDLARRDLSEGVSIALDQRLGFATAPERLAFAETARHLGEEFVSLEIEAKRPEHALAATDRLRSWDLPGVRGDPAIDPAQLSRLLPPDTTIAYYNIGERDSYVWAIRAAGIQTRPIASTRGDLRSLIAAAMLAEELDSNAMRRLTDLLIQPIADALPAKGRLVIIPDGPLHELPFAALGGRRARWLGEEQILSQAPSLSSFLAASRALAHLPGAVSSIVAVGGPALPPAFAGLPLLPYAAGEAGNVARLYSTSALLVEREATSEAMLDAMTKADVLHFAGHGILNDLYPEESQLGITDRDGRALTAAAIARLRVPRLRLAVLAACQSLGGRSSRGQGPMSLARAFLQSGVPSVLANRWLVDDAAAAALSMRFHRVYRETGDAALALQRAQLALIGSGDRRLTSPRAWAGWTLIGGTAPAAATARDHASQVRY